MRHLCPSQSEKAKSKRHSCVSLTQSHNSQDRSLNGHVIYHFINEIRLSCGLSSHLLKISYQAHEIYTPFSLVKPHVLGNKFPSSPYCLLLWQNRCQVTVKTLKISISCQVSDTHPSQFRDECQHILVCYF